MDYKTYLESAAWHNKCRNVRAFWGNRCAICNSAGMLHIHHRDYANLGHEHFNDLIVLCDHCHALYHNQLTPLQIFDRIGKLCKGTP